MKPYIKNLVQIEVANAQIQDHIKLHMQSISIVMLDQ